MLYTANADLIKGVQLVATLDGRTTLICELEDGNVYALGRGPRPPLHYNCRTTTVPVVKSFRELGLKGPRVTDNVRASMRGEVPAKLRYDQWLRRQPIKIQNQALGPVRGAIYRANPKMKLGRFADDLQRPMPLEQLAAFDSELILNLSDELFAKYKHYFGQMGSMTQQALNPVPELLKGIPKTRMASWAGSQGMTPKQTMAMLAEAGHDTTINSVRTFIKYGRQGKNLPEGLSAEQLAMLRSLKEKAEKVFPKKVVKPPPVAVVTVDDVVTSRLIAWLGSEGLTNAEVRAVLNAMGREAKENTIKTFRYKGSKFTNLPALKREQVDYLRGVIDAARKGATVVKPPVPVTTAVLFDDVATSRIIAHFGSRGMSTGEIRAALREIGLEAKDNTIKTFRYRGKKGDSLPKALSVEQRELLNKIETKIRGGTVEPIPAGAEVVSKGAESLAANLEKLTSEIGNWAAAAGTNETWMQGRVVAELYREGLTHKEVLQLVKGMGWDKGKGAAGAVRGGWSQKAVRDIGKDFIERIKRFEASGGVLNKEQQNVIRNIRRGWQAEGKLPEEILLRAKYGARGDVKTFSKVDELAEEVKDQGKRVARVEAREKVLYERLAKAKSGSAEYDAIHDEIWQLKVARSSESVAFRERLHQVLREANENKQKLKYKGYDGDLDNLTYSVLDKLQDAGMEEAASLGAEARRKVDAGLDWLRNVYQRRVRQQPVWVRHEGGKYGRAYHSGDSRGKRSISNIALPDKTEVATAIHEYGHHIEQIDARVQRAVTKFYKKRTKGETLQVKRGTAFARDAEYTLEDKFIDWYIGKWYGSVGGDVKTGLTANMKWFPKGHSEIVSMGLQMMYESPLQLYTKDREMFDLILRIMLDMELP
jgi:hypothetical protein